MLASDVLNIIQHVRFAWPRELAYDGTIGTSTGFRLAVAVGTPVRHWPVITAEMAGMVMEAALARWLDERVNHWATIRTPSAFAVFDMMRPGVKQIGSGPTRLEALVDAARNFR